jgi:hypothetical protein
MINRQPAKQTNAYDCATWEFLANAFWKITEIDAGGRQSEICDRDLTRWQRNNIWDSEAALEVLCRDGLQVTIEGFIGAIE